MRMLYAAVTVILIAHALASSGEQRHVRIQFQVSGIRISRRMNWRDHPLSKPWFPGGRWVHQSDVADGGCGNPGHWCGTSEHYTWLWHVMSPEASVCAQIGSVMDV